MSKMKYQNQTDGVYDIKAAGSKRKNFILWREVAMAYIAPAIMAGIGGLVTADRSLQIGALTTIGVTSALVAWMLGLWLRSRGARKRWIIGPHRLVVVGMFGVAGIAFGLFAAWVTADLLGTMIPMDQLAWVDRVWIDFPLSGFIASTIVTWRWRDAITTNYSFKGEDNK
ncbi:hypothetical protein [Paenibacillus ferrarius]|nr:hypothetical protein [Paenibacillus ferrarius]